MFLSLCVIDDSIRSFLEKTRQDEMREDIILRHLIDNAEQISSSSSSSLC